MRPGDLAIQIKSVAGNEGKLVTLIAHVGEILYCNLELKDSWLVDYGKNVYANFNGKLIAHEREKVCPTAWLKPLPPPETEITERKENELSCRN